MEKVLRPPADRARIRVKERVGCGIVKTLHRRTTGQVIYNLRFMAESTWWNITHGMAEAVDKGYKRKSRKQRQRKRSLTCGDVPMTSVGRCKSCWGVVSIKSGHTAISNARPQEGARHQCIAVRGSLRAERRKDAIAADIAEHDRRYAGWVAWARCGGLRRSAIVCSRCARR